VNGADEDPLPTQPSHRIHRMDNEALREELANYAHEAWSDWMNYLFGMSRKNDDGSVTIPQGSLNVGSVR
jgi:hypothetical protein